MATLLSGSSAFAYTAVGAPGKIGDIPRVKQQAAWNTLGCLNALNHPASDSDTINGINDITSFNWPSSGWTSSGNNGDLRLGIATSGGVYADKSQNTGCTKEATPYAFTALGKNISASSSTADKMNLLCEIGYTQTKMSSNSSTAPRSNCASTTTRGNDDQFAHSAGATQWTLPARPLTREAELYVTFATMISDSSNSGDCWKPATSDGTTVAGYTQTNIITIGTNADRLLVKPILWKDGSSCWGSEYVTTNSATTLSSYAQAFSNETGIKIGVDDGDGSATDPTDPDSSNTDVGTAQDPCYAAQTHGFGWIVCPGMTWMTAAIDGLVGWITGGLQWTMLTDTAGDSGATIRDVWASMLTLANIAFAIAFMIIIYSTATSSGISNYGIKKILPRLVVAAVGVNLSFYLCAALADLSNIAGVGLNDLIMARMSGGNNGATMFGTLWDGLLKAGVTLLIVIFTWATVFIGMLTIFIAIALRTVALTMLVIVSPLAIVASLLPNTEKWFKKWRDTYIQLLVVYPAFMVVWAGCRLVANVATNTGADWSWMISSLATLAPLAVIIPLFKSTSGLMGKMTSLTEKGIGAAGGNLLKNLNKTANGYLRSKAAQTGKNFASGRVDRAQDALKAAASGVEDAQSDASAANSKLAELTTKKNNSVYTQEDKDALTGLRNKIRAGTALSREETAREAQLSRKAAAARGVVGANTWSSNDEAALQTAQNNAQTANARLSSASATHSAAQRIYSKRANGLLRRAAFLTSDMRFKKARREADAKHTEQKELGRLLQESEGFQKSYAGITPGMYEGAAEQAVRRAVNEAQAISDKQGDEERQQMASYFGNTGATKVTSGGKEINFAANTPMGGDNSLVTKLLTADDATPVEITMADGRVISSKTLTDNERMVLSQQVLSTGSTPEVAQVRNAVHKIKDGVVRSAVAQQVIKSGNKDFLQQGANNARLQSGDEGSHGQQLIRVAQNPLEANTLDRYAKPAFWDDAIKGLPEVQQLAAIAGDEGRAARDTLANLRGAIEAQLKQPGASKYVQAVGKAYTEILRAQGMSDQDIKTLFASAK